jgi:hypothetical protein
MQMMKKTNLSVKRKMFEVQGGDPSKGSGSNQKVQFS